MVKRGYAGQDISAGDQPFLQQTLRDEAGLSLGFTGDIGEYSLHILGIGVWLRWRPAYFLDTLRNSHSSEELCLSFRVLYFLV